MKGQISIKNYLKSSQGSALLLFLVLFCFCMYFKNNLLKDMPVKCKTSIYVAQNEIDPSILALYRSQVLQRKRLLKTVEKTYNTLYNVLVPEVFCRNLIRIGSVHDGGKWICNPNQLLSMDECTVYSLGVRNDPSFEHQFQSFVKNKCKLRSIDKKEQIPATVQRIDESNGVFIKATVSNTTNLMTNESTIKDILNSMGDKRVDIFKIDIEGTEFEISDELISVQICQILIEIHSQEARKTLQLLQKLSLNGFYLFSYEINGGLHYLSEYSFIHESCFQDYGVNVVLGRYLT